MKATIKNTVFSAHLSVDDFNEEKSAEQFAEMVDNAISEWMEKYYSELEVIVTSEIDHKNSGVGGGISVFAEDDEGFPSSSLENEVESAMTALSERIFSEGEWFVEAK